MMEKTAKRKRNDRIEDFYRMLVQGHMKETAKEEKIRSLQAVVSFQCGVIMADPYGKWSPKFEKIWHEVENEHK